MHLLRLLAAISSLAIAATAAPLEKKDVARLVRRVEIGDPDDIGYGNGGGAKVPDDLDAQYLDERSFAPLESRDIGRLIPRVEIGDPDDIGYGNGGGAKVPDDVDAQYLDEQK